MSNIEKSLLWAGAILGVALLAKAYGLNDAATFGLIAAMSGAAIGSIAKSGSGGSCINFCRRIRG